MLVNKTERSSFVLCRNILSEKTCNYFELKKNLFYLGIVSLRFKNIIEKYDSNVSDKFFVLLFCLSIVLTVSYFWKR